MSDQQHVTIRVDGIVQGVNYRQAARQAAERLQITGYACNEADGSVIVEAEGLPAALEQFVTWCRNGLDAARVDRISVSHGPLVGYVGFSRW